MRWTDTSRRQRKERVKWQWKDKAETERERLEFEKMKAENDHQKWLSENEQRKVQQEREVERRTDEALNVTRSGSVVPIGMDPIDAVAFFRELFSDYGIPETFQANPVGPCLNKKAKQIVRLSCFELFNSERYNFV